MRPVSFSVDTLAAALRRLKVASLPQLVEALGGPSVRTVFRKFQQLDSISSYSHRGRFYALRACGRFDASGLWCHQGIRFSTHGTLRATVPELAAAVSLFASLLNEKQRRLFAGLASLLYGADGDRPAAT